MLEASAVLLLVVTACALLALANRVFASDDNTLVEAIDRALPQTQCAQCGYPGCRPYAEAVANGEALDLCPPGGTDTLQKLQLLLPERSASGTVSSAPASVALIDESRCIGCYLCIKACPVDAIVGAPKYMHTVITKQCTGCELCVPPCPVDCIEMVPK